MKLKQLLQVIGVGASDGEVNELPTIESIAAAIGKLTEDQLEAEVFIETHSLKRGVKDFSVSEAFFEDQAAEGKVWDLALRLDPADKPPRSMLYITE